MDLLVTVVIPVHNQAYRLSLTLFGFTRQNIPHQNFRIVVVDDGSQEPIDSIVESYQGLLNLTYIRITKSGRAAARNVGARLVDTGIVVFCDADRIPRPQFLKQHLESAMEHNSSITVGQVRELYVRNAESNRQHIMECYLRERRDRQPQYCSLVYSLFGENRKTTSAVPWIATLSGNLSMPIATFRDLQGFDESFNTWGFEHMEFGYRAHTRGIPFLYEPRAVNIHIAHPRESDSSYEQYIRISHEYFYSKHSTPEVKRFLDFMLGEISLSQLEAIAHGEESESRTFPGRDGFVRITNFKSQ